MPQQLSRHSTIKLMRPWPSGRPFVFQHSTAIFSMLHCNCAVLINRRYEVVITLHGRCSLAPSQCSVCPRTVYVPKCQFLLLATGQFGTGPQHGHHVCHICVDPFQACRLYLFSHCNFGLYTGLLVADMTIEKRWSTASIWLSSRFSMTCQWYRWDRLRILAY
jgi:hypothetical protein